MKKLLVATALSLFATISYAQLIYGNTFPFWTVTGNLTNTQLTASMPVFTDANKVLVSGTSTGTGAVVLGTSPTITTSLIPGGASFDLLNTTATTINFGGAATTMAVGAATGTVTVGPALVGSIATESTSATTGAWKTAGGLGVAKNLSVGGHPVVTSGATTITSGNCGATTNGTVAGNDTSGLVTIASAATTTCKVTFAATYAAAPKACILMAANAAAIAATTLPYVNAIATTYFQFTGAVLASTNWYYLCL